MSVAGARGGDGVCVSGRPARVRTADPQHPPDMRAVAAVARATWPAAYRGILPAQAVAEHLRTAYRPEALAARPGLDGGFFLLAEARRPSGRWVAVGFCQAGRRPAAPTDADLWAIYVRPRWQGRGFGRALVEAAAERLGRVRLHVALARGNAAAEAFYGRLGFVPEGSGYEATIQDVTLPMRAMVRVPGKA